VVGGGEVVERHLLAAVQRMAPPEHAHVVLPEEPALEVARLQLRQQADREVDVARLHLVLQVDRGVAHGAQRDIGRDPRDLLHQPGQEVDLADVRHADGEGALRGGRIERGLPVHRGMDDLQRARRRLGELLRIGRGLHAAGRAQEERIVGELAQPRERIAHARLREAEAGRHLRDPAIDEQLLEDDQEVEIDVLQLHRRRLTFLKSI